jgi:hypothetical protein
MYENFTIPSSDTQNKVLSTINSDPLSNTYKNNDNRVLLEVLRKIDKKWKEALAKKDKLVSKMKASDKSKVITKEIASIRAAQDAKKAALKKGLKSKSSNILSKLGFKGLKPSSPFKIAKAGIKGINKILSDRINNLEKELKKLKSSNPNSDWKYNTFNYKNMKPIGANLQSWSNDYVLLNTDKWAPSINPAPVCKTEKKCPVCPNMSAGYAKQYTTLKDFHSSRKVMPPDTINVDYINNKLNKGL